MFYYKLFQLIFQHTVALSEAKGLSGTTVVLFTAISEKLVFSHSILYLFIPEKFYTLPTRNDDFSFM